MAYSLLIHFNGRIWNGDHAWQRPASPNGAFGDENHGPVREADGVWIRPEEGSVVWVPFTEGTTLRLGRVGGGFTLEAIEWSHRRVGPVDDFWFGRLPNNVEGWWSRRWHGGEGESGTRLSIDEAEFGFDLDKRAAQRVCEHLEWEPAGERCEQIDVAWVDGRLVFESPGQLPLSFRVPTLEGRGPMRLDVEPVWRPRQLQLLRATGAEEAAFVPVEEEATCRDGECPVVVDFGRSLLPERRAVTLNGQSFVAAPEQTVQPMDGPPMYRLVDEHARETPWVTVKRLSQLAPGGRVRVGLEGLAREWNVSIGFELERHHRFGARRCNERRVVAESVPEEGGVLGAFGPKEPLLPGVGAGEAEDRGWQLLELGVELQPLIEPLGGAPLLVGRPGAPLGELEAGPVYTLWPEQWRERPGTYGAVVKAEASLGRGVDWQPVGRTGQLPDQTYHEVFWCGLVDRMRVVSVRWKGADGGDVKGRWLCFENGFALNDDFWAAAPLAGLGVLPERAGSGESMTLMNAWAPGPRAEAIRWQGDGTVLSNPTWRMFDCRGRRMTESVEPEAELRLEGGVEVVLVGAAARPGMLGAPIVRFCAGQRPKLCGMVAGEGGFPLPGGRVLPSGDEGVLEQTPVFRAC